MNTIKTNKLSIKNLSSSKLNIESLSTSEFNCFDLETIHSIAQNADVSTLIMENLVVGNINVNNSTSNTVETSNLSGTNLSSEEGEINSLEADDINVNSELKVNNSLTTNELKATNIPDEPVYSNPGEGTFRGICFFQNVDVGIGNAPHTKVSLNMKCDGITPRIRSHNKFTGSIDSDPNSVFTLCTNTTPARILRYGPSNALQIYSNNTLIWQNGNNISDVRLKENIINMSPSESMKKILKINGILYNSEFEEDETSGVILEEIRDVYPECIVNDTLVHLELLVPLLIEGVKELHARQKIINEYMQSEALSRDI